MRQIGLVALTLLAFAACTTPRPTSIQENMERRLEPAAAEVIEIKVDEKTVILDARPAFDYTLSHIPRAISLQWTDFTQQDEAYRGVLLADRFALARRLARLGISPDSKVVVVGRGVNGGDGEEGRLAWTLAYLGVKDVRVAPMSYFKGPLTTQASSPLAPVPMWKPEVQEGLLATQKELLKVIGSGGVHKSVAMVKGQPERLYRIIDVRTPREYLGKEGIGLQAQIPNMDAINISWKEFFDSNGRPNPYMKKQLVQVGIDGTQRLIVLSERGLRSSAVTMALRELGFTDVANYAGGLRELMATDKKSLRQESAPSIQRRKRSTNR